MLCLAAVPAQGMLSAVSPMVPGQPHLSCSPSHQARGTSDSPSPSWFCLCKDLCRGESSSVHRGLVEEG